MFVLIPHDPIRGTLHALTRAAVYGMFAQLLIVPDDADAVADRFEQAFNLCGAVPARLPFAWSTATLLASISVARDLDVPRLQERYGGLFGATTAGALPLRESSALADDALGEARLAKAYERFGYAPLEPLPLDHLAQQLEFLRHLMERESDQGTPESRRELRAAQLEFIEHHVGRWLPALGVAAAPLAGRCPFGGTIVALAQWLHKDLHWLGSSVQG